MNPLEEGDLVRALSRGKLWAAVGMAGIGLALLMVIAGLRIDASHMTTATQLSLLGVLAAAVRSRVAGARFGRLVDLVECWGLMALISTMGALASYAIVRLTNGEADAWLAAVDRTLGFDWVSAYRFYADRPLLARFAEVAYLSIFFSPTVVITALALSGDAERARGLAAAFGIALLITLAIFCFCPARSALAYHLGSEVDYMPATGIGHLAAMDQLRAGAMTVIDIRSLAGMITFPSFHAVSAVLFIWAAWPVAWLRWPCLAINLAMLIVTPVQGTHYLIDVIGGVTVALVAIGALYLPRPRLRIDLRMPWRPALG